MTSRLVKGNLFEADGGQLEHDPLRRVADFAGLGWIGAHRFDAQELVELTQVAVPVLPQVRQRRRKRGVRFSRHSADDREAPADAPAIG